MSQRDYFEKDYYAILGVPKTATTAEIAKAYRKLARENHPDAKPGDASAEARFKEASEAYAVLNSPEKRKEYDQVRDMVGAGFRGPGTGGFGGFGPTGGTAFDLNDLLGGLFSNEGGATTFNRRRRGGVGAQRGADIETEVNLGFADAVAGATVTLRLSGRATCSVCDGSGAAPGTIPERCPTCAGRGVISDNQGLFSFSQPCPTCAGRGQRITHPCERCRGTGVENRPREIKARIPAGVKDGARVKLAGKGEPGLNGGPPGDLYVVVKVDRHPVFGRRDDHLTVTVPVTFAEAALGTRVTVPTLDGPPVTVKIPAGTASGTTLRVRGRGVRSGANGKAGDLLVTADVQVPRKLTKTQRKLLEDYAATDQGGVRDHLDRLVAEQTERTADEGVPS